MPTDFTIEETRTFLLRMPNDTMLALTLDQLSDLYDEVGRALDKARGGSNAR